MMTREEAVELLCYGDWLNVISEHIGEMDTERIAEAMSIVGKALRPVSREQVEKVWNGCINCHDKEKLAKHIHCWPSFCPVCGRPLTAEAVQMVMERVEALHGET